MKEELYSKGVMLALQFCQLNGIPMPSVTRLRRGERLYKLATCAFYRPTTISIMVEKCANNGYGGRAWSWPGYTIDRTPYGVIQHELGHHVDRFCSMNGGEGRLFSQVLNCKAEGEVPLTGYLGTDSREKTFFMEWFAENFRLFVTNPDLSRLVRPKFYARFVEVGIKPLALGTWDEVLRAHGAPERTMEQARKKIGKAPQARQEMLL